MTHPTPRPATPIRIRTYAALRPWLDGFRDGKINLLFLTGRPGLGKSRLIRHALADREYLLAEGHATPFKMYAELYRHRDRPVVIDDEDSFHAAPQKVRLMKCLCNTEPVKRVAWESTTKMLADLGLPVAFETTSRVAVLTNQVAAVNPHVAALFDRGNVLAFDPPAAEIHARVETWFPDREVLTFFARWLPVITAPSMRLYVKAGEMKAAGIDWRKTLLGQWRASKLWLVDRVQRDPTLATEDERATAFHALHGGSRATYFRHLQKWRTRIAGPETDAPSGDEPLSPVA